MRWRLTKSRKISDPHIKAAPSDKMEGAAFSERLKSVRHLILKNMMVHIISDYYKIKKNIS